MRRAILVVVDGLRADMANARYMPALASLCARGTRFNRHTAAFPSATRVNSATISTGCFPSRHGLYGNAIALDEGAGLVPVAVGPASFRERWRQATGRTLLEPTLAEHLAPRGGAMIYTNSSAGAAHMQDPEGFGYLFHRSGSHGPGLTALSLDFETTYDASGDQFVTERFCAAVRDESSAQVALHVLWICEPDHSQHALELGSDAHLEVLAGADSCIQKVADSIDFEDPELLVLLTSDHGHETVCEAVHVPQLLVDAGFKQALDSNDAVVASSGMSALIFLDEQSRRNSAAIADWLERQDWTAQVLHGGDLAEVGLRSQADPAAGKVPGGAASPAPDIAIAMAKRPGANQYGIEGFGVVAADSIVSADCIGLGQHGGLGAYETAPFLAAIGNGFTRAQSASASHAVDLAPTILQHLGGFEVQIGAVDGNPLQRFSHI